MARRRGAFCISRSCCLVFSRWEAEEGCQVAWMITSFVVGLRLHSGTVGLEYCGKPGLHAHKDETLGGLVALNLGCEVYGVEES